MSGHGDFSNPRLNHFFIDQSADDDLSEPMFKGHLDIMGLRFPGAWTAANVVFYESETETGTFNTVEWETAGVLALTGGAGKTIMFDPAKLSGLKWLKIGTTVGQADDRTVTPIYRDFS